MANSIPFFTCEFDTYAPGSVPTFAMGHGTRPHGTFDLIALPVADSRTVRVSDLGYTSLSADSIGVKAFPPSMDQAFAIQRRLPLDVNEVAAAAGWGEVILQNSDGAYDTMAASSNSDARDITIKRGLKTMDDSPLPMTARSTTATYIDPAGTISSVAAGVVRYNWSGGTATIVDEDAATNYFVSSTALTSWVSNEASVVVTNPSADVARSIPVPTC